MNLRLPKSALAGGLFFFLAVASARFAQAGEREIDKVVAVIEQQPILLSDLELEARVALIQQGGTAAADADELGREVLNRTLEHVINQRLVQREADRLQVLRLDEAARRQVYEDFVRQLGGEMAFQAFLTRHELYAPQIEAILERDLRVAQFLANKVGVSARVGEAEAREYFESHPKRFGGADFAASRAAIVALLTRERVMALTSQLLDDLRSRAELRVLPPFSQAGDMAPRASPSRIVPIEPRSTADQSPEADAGR
ncbi:MAG: hypothetical protein IKC51_01920 [Myxococcaceae bacterium]|nr:hypothetical protein [Myxococcaceae bacterium]